MSEGSSVQHPAPATSLYDLLHRLTNIPTALESESWEGLETESARRARAEAKQVWQSFASTFFRGGHNTSSVSGRERKLTARGARQQVHAGFCKRTTS